MAKYEMVRNDAGWEQQWDVDRRHIRDAIGAAARDHEKELFLYSEGLLHVPAGAVRLVQLERLHLGANQLTMLPEAIVQLKHLQQIGLGRNRFSAFPEILCHLPNLQELLLFDNLLRELPPSVGRLTALRRLQLQRNQLQGLPATICHLKALCELELHGNALRTLPPSLCQLSPALSLHGAVKGTLTRLTLHNNDPLESELAAAPSAAAVLGILQQRYAQWAQSPNAALPELPALPHADFVLDSAAPGGEGAGHGRGHAYRDPNLSINVGYEGGAEGGGPSPQSPFGGAGAVSPGGDAGGAAAAVPSPSRSVHARWVDDDGTWLKGGMVDMGGGGG